MFFHRQIFSSQRKQGRGGEGERERGGEGEGRSRKARKGGRKAKKGIKRDERKYKIQGMRTLKNSSLPIVAAARSLRYEGISVHYQKKKQKVYKREEGEGEERGRGGRRGRGRREEDGREMGREDTSRYKRIQVFFVGQEPAKQTQQIFCAVKRIRSLVLHKFQNFLSVRVRREGEERTLACTHGRLPFWEWRVSVSTQENKHKKRKQQKKETKEETNETIV